MFGFVFFVFFCGFFAPWVGWSCFVWFPCFLFFASNMICGVWGVFFLNFFCEDWLFFGVRGGGETIEDMYVVFIM